MPAGFTIPSIFTAIDRFSGPMRGMRNSVQDFVATSEIGLAKAERGFRRLLTPLAGLNRLLAGMGYYVGLFTLILLLRNAVGVMADFQQANVNLATVMETTVQKNKALADDARKIGLFYGQAATEVSKLQFSLATLGFQKNEILAMGGPIVTGAVALQATTEQVAELVGGMVKTFDNFSAGDTQRILDLMANAGFKTALNFEKLATTLPIVAAPANALGIKFETLLALLGTLSNAQVHVATSATSLKNIFIDSQKRGHTYAQVLDNIAAKADKLTYAYNKFGKRSVVSALVLANKLRETAQLQRELEETKPGLIQEVASQRLNTFKGTATLAKAAYQEFILSIEDGTGKYASTLMQMNRVIAAMLLLSSDSDQARQALSQMDPVVIELANKWLFFVKAVLALTAAIIAARIAIAAWTVVMYAARVALFAFNVALGISTAIMGGSWVTAARGGAVAMAAYKAVTWLATTATWAWNAALAANPIVWVIGLIVAVIGWTAIVVEKWNEWGAAASMLTMGIGSIVTVVQSFRRNWEMIMEAFTSGGMIAGVKAIGVALYDALLMPMQQIYSLIGKITGADWATKIATDIQSLRSNLGVNPFYDESGNKIAGTYPTPNGKPLLNSSRVESEKVDRESRSGDDFKPNAFGKILLEADLPYWMKAKSDSDSLKIVPSLNSTMNY